MSDFTLHLPGHDHQRGLDELQLLHMLLDTLISQPDRVQRAEADQGTVRSGNPRLAELLTMLGRASMLDALVDQMNYALFVDVEQGKTGILAASVNGRDHAFRFEQRAAPPQLQWVFSPIVFG
ncbi:hypothetical protein IGB42_04155 [Andreprevotia sp. IGB-42]|uniref:hypothetical protein n=1 Tax=Andreprevotia sp. IGB-42 TaxID=2497473 RepID=UPI001356A2A3|nr:hypothetical protein [Andreprevotia sp. IGB-42]KAF0811389.1 hypothetical protein IGB42_04155 [Andreprevotia sp. IGB-42]